MSALIELHARVYFLTPEEGGRKTPVLSGYKPSIFFDKDGTMSIVFLDQENNTEAMLLGREYKVRIVMNYRERLDVLTPGASFQLREGLRVTARGTISKVRVCDEE